LPGNQLLKKVAHHWLYLHQFSFDYLVEARESAENVHVVAPLMVTDAQRDVPRKREGPPLTTHLEINSEFLSADIARIAYQRMPP
jgi:hypothetical protein